MNTGLKELTWQRTIILCAMLAFSSLVLWIYATVFDATEIKSLLTLFVGFLIREFLPIVAQLLRPTTEALGRGGQLE